jgi:flagellar hook assembly protein FlgD
MAQFSSLEQMTNLNEQFQEFRKSSRSMEGFSLLGKRIDAYLSAQQRRVSGTVTSIRFINNQMRFQVGNDEVSLSDIHAVHEPARENREEAETVSKTIQN